MVGHGPGTLGYAQTQALAAGESICPVGRHRPRFVDLLRRYCVRLIIDVATGKPDVRETATGIVPIVESREAGEGSSGELDGEPGSMAVDA